MGTVALVDQFRSSVPDHEWAPGDVSELLHFQVTLQVFFIEGFGAEDGNGKNRKEGEENEETGHDDCSRWEQMNRMKGERTERGRCCNRWQRALCLPEQKRPSRVRPDPCQLREALLNVETLLEQVIFPRIIVIHVQEGHGRVFHFGDSGVAFGNFGIEWIKRETREYEDWEKEKKREEHMSRHDSCSCEPMEREGDREEWTASQREVVSIPMSHFPIFLLFDLFSLSSCSQQFEDHFEICFKKLTKWQVASSLRDRFGGKVIDTRTPKQCRRLESCFFELTEIGTPEELEKAEVGYVLRILKKVCKSFEKREKSSQNLIRCIEKMRPEFFTLKKTPNHLSENCEFTPDEMVKLDELVLQKCGLGYWKKFKKEVDYVKTIPCMKQYDDMNKFFV